ncbi:MAG: hypothetical protein FWD76_04135 [Firmicutes bacterium]|nr:hypothetical protein [Bacillota bacterium]
MKYFGTDGIRGVVGKDLDRDLCYKVGLCLCKQFGKGVYVVGRDTRLSGKILQEGIVQGIVAGGGRVLCVGVLPTPGIAFLTREYKAQCGVVLSASHNPPNYNGIKIFDSKGAKPSESVECEIETLIGAYIRPQKNPGFVKHIRKARECYERHLMRVEVDLRGVHIVLDCAFGAASTFAKKVFEQKGAIVHSYHDKRQGGKINCQCGALYPACIQEFCKLCKADIGFAFDGDADRVVICAKNLSSSEEPYIVLDGDSVLYNLSRALPQNRLVVGTILNNTALETALDKDGKKLIRVAVGDKHIAHCMQQTGAMLGGEQSGHYILGTHATTGDGILTALMFLKATYRSGHCTYTLLDLLPQKSLSLYADKNVLQAKPLQALVAKWEALLQSKGRLVVRMSGTEPKIRISCEAESVSVIQECLQEFEDCVRHL